MTKTVNQSVKNAYCRTRFLLGFSDLSTFIHRSDARIRTVSYRRLVGAGSLAPRGRRGAGGGGGGGALFILGGDEPDHVQLNLQPYTRLDTENPYPIPDLLFYNCSTISAF